MIVAYFIALHHKFAQFRWLFDAIYSSDDIFLIHVDRKASPSFLEAVRSYVAPYGGNVAFLPSRPVAWGGWSQVALELAAIEALTWGSSGWSYYVNLSGQDYPIKSRAAIWESLRSAWPRNFVGVHRFAEIRQTEPDDPHLKRRLVVDLLGRRRITTPLRLPLPKAIDLEYKGSSWHILSRDFCRWLLDAPVRRTVERRLRFTTSPDEVFFQAMIMNGPFADARLMHCGREVIWPGPKILDIGDYDRLLRSPALFARKFDETVDRVILERLAERNGYPVPSEGDPGRRRATPNGQSPGSPTDRRVGRVA